MEADRCRHRHQLECIGKVAVGIQLPRLDQELSNNENTFGNWARNFAASFDSSARINTCASNSKSGTVVTRARLCHIIMLLEKEANCSMQLENVSILHG